ncbi:hypothetical protein [Halomonas sp. YLGW01]|uniref:hypothetical protein n=1 Tax=Halomonas sp. YLGW01 TaxID=2773308 RepID=UPI00177E0AA0|nr:hypothetical protein [Halomonas sp. YLGW01]
MTASATPERLSVLTGLVLVMLASVPRYLLEGHETRLTLLMMAAVVVIVVGGLHWRLMERGARRQLPVLLKRLVVCLLGGGCLMAIWQGLSLGGLDGVLLLAHGAALGLLLHVVGLPWRRQARD